MSTLNCKVVMLPIEKATNDKGDLVYYEGDGENPRYIGIRKADYNHSTSYLKPQHLYLVSDREIKEGDWYVVLATAKNNEPLRVVKCSDTVFNNPKYLKEEGGFKKIEATTDKSLSLNEGGKVNLGCLPIPNLPESFIQAYVKANGKINEVVVEVELEESEETKKWFEEKLSKKLPDLEYIIKIRPDNTVIVHLKEEKLYTKEDLLNAFKAGRERIKHPDWDYVYETFEDYLNKL